MMVRRSLPESGLSMHNFSKLSARSLQELTFREMCGESAFVPESELNFVRKVGSGSFAQGEPVIRHL